MPKALFMPQNCSTPIQLHHQKQEKQQKHIIPLIPKTSHHPSFSHKGNRRARWDKRLGSKHHQSAVRRRASEFSRHLKTSKLLFFCDLLWGEDALDFIVPARNGILAFQSGFNTRVAADLEERLWQKLSLKARCQLLARCHLSCWHTLHWLLCFARLRRLVPRWFSSAMPSVSTKQLESLAIQLLMQSFCRNCWDWMTSFGRSAKDYCHIVRAASLKRGLKRAVIASHSQSSGTTCEMLGLKNLADSLWIRWLSGYARCPCQAGGVSLPSACCIGLPLVRRGLLSKWPQLEDCRYHGEISTCWRITTGSYVLRKSSNFPVCQQC